MGRKVPSWRFAPDLPHRSGRRHRAGRRIHVVIEFAVERGAVPPRREVGADVLAVEVLRREAVAHRVRADHEQEVVLLVERPEVALEDGHAPERLDLDARRREELAGDVDRLAAARVVGVEDARHHAELAVPEVGPHHRAEVAVDDEVGRDEVGRVGELVAGARPEVLLAEGDAELAEGQLQLGFLGVDRREDGVGVERGDGLPGEVDLELDPAPGAERAHGAEPRALHGERGLRVEHDLGTVVVLLLGEPGLDPAVELDGEVAVLGRLEDGDLGSGGRRAGEEERGGEGSGGSSHRVGGSEATKLMGDVRRAGGSSVETW